MLSQSNVEDTRKLAEGIRSKYTDFLSRFKTPGAGDRQGSPGAAAEDPTTEDAVLGSVLKFIRDNGEEVLAGTQSLALMSKTLRHLNARSREVRRRRGGSLMKNTSVVSSGTAGAASGGSMASSGGEKEAGETAPATPVLTDPADASEIDEVSEFFGKMTRIRFKRDPSLEGAEEQTDLNLELFPALREVELTGITVLHVRAGDGVEKLVLNDGGGFAPEVQAFPGCRTLQQEGGKLGGVSSVGGEQGLSALLLESVTDAIETLSSPPPSLQGLQELRLAKMELKEIPKAVTKFPQLRSLSLAHNAIANVGGLAEMPLTSLDLSSNNLQGLDWLVDAECVQAEKIEELDVSGHSAITSTRGLEPALMPSLRSLSLARCGISDWAELEPFRSLLCLESLRLIGNPIYTNPRNDKEARLLILEVLPHLRAPAAFRLDGTTVQRHELKFWQGCHERSGQLDRGESFTGSELPGDAEGQRHETGLTVATEKDTPSMQPRSPLALLGMRSELELGNVVHMDDVPSTTVRSPKNRLRGIGKTGERSTSPAGDSPRGKKVLKKVTVRQKVKTEDAGVQTDASELPASAVERVQSEKSIKSEAPTVVPTPSPSRNASQAPPAPEDESVWENIVLMRVKRCATDAGIEASLRPSSLDASDWRSGITLCAIVNALAPGSLDVGNMTAISATSNLEAGFSVAKKELEVPPPAGGTRVVESRHSLAMYLSALLMAGADGDSSRLRKARKLSDRLLKEVMRYREQRHRDRKRIARSMGDDDLTDSDTE
eukprot:Hpha_TRINITY_DN16823_c1_g4::TRINITY_DN16823_c1_g4_i1::g.150365::m.150365